MLRSTHYIPGLVLKAMASFKHSWIFFTYFEHAHTSQTTSQFKSHNLSSRKKEKKRLFQNELLIPRISLGRKEGMGLPLSMLSPRARGRAWYGGRAVWLPTAVPACRDCHSHTGTGTGHHCTQGSSSFQGRWVLRGLPAGNWVGSFSARGERPSLHPGISQVQVKASSEAGTWPVFFSPWTSSSHQWWLFKCPFVNWRLQKTLLFYPFILKAK